MWLLSVKTAELHLFASPADVDGGYAILSHTWGTDEQTFQDLQALEEKCRPTGENPRDQVSEKIRQSCILAEKDGFMWIWNDTCCINKTSSSELSEAINSMFRWYASSEVCYAYLADVPSDCDLAAPDSPFRKSRWHTRGWTLQELIAPPFVLFISQTWTVLGSKTKLAKTIQEISGIHWQVLTHAVDFSTQSVATRMAWASRRQTTRVEDGAYCLMGLFGVNMPTIYGEGSQAFQRLQRKIMKQSTDTSLFVWGPQMINHAEIDPDSLMSCEEIYDKFPFPPLAPSPESFASFHGAAIYHSPHVFNILPQQGSRQVPYEPEHKGPFGELELPRFTSTPHGIEARFPIFEMEGVTIAVLMCQTFDQFIGLLLYPSSRNHDPRRRMYHVGLGISDGKGMRITRLVALGKNYYNMTIRGQPVTPKWHDICIASDNEVTIRKSNLPSMMSPLNSLLPAPPFRFPHWIVGRLNAMGMPQLKPVNIWTDSTAPKNTPLLAIIECHNRFLAEAIFFYLGMCDGSCRDATATSSKAATFKKRTIEHWAKVYVLHSGNWHTQLPVSHDCAVDHIATWPNFIKEFGDETRTVRLSFSRCPLTPATTLVAGVELAGSVYEQMAQNRGVTLPSRRRSGTSTGTDDTTLRRTSVRTNSAPSPGAHDSSEGSRQIPSFPTRAFTMSPVPTIHASPAAPQASSRRATRLPQPIRRRRGDRE